MTEYGLACRPFYTYKLLEAIEPSEYNALSEANREKVRMIVSCGLIDMNEGNPTREKLFQLFPDGTVTYDRLVELMSYVPPPM